MPIDPAVLRYYERGEEHGRLVGEAGDRLELLRTKELLLRHLPAAPADVLDVGGGTGRYASWLAGLGHRVRLVDPVPLHVEQAGAAAAAGPGFEVSLGDARALDAGDRSQDVVVLLGPLYHLPDAADRARALGEAHRVLRPGGVLAVAAISRFASAIDGVVKGFVAEPAFRSGVLATLGAGVHRSAEHFTTAYFHRPEELAAEVVRAGFEDVVVYGVEGPGGYQADESPAWSDPAFRQDVLAMARAVEREASFLGYGPHLLAIGRRPGLPSA